MDGIVVLLARRTARFMLLAASLSGGAACNEADGTERWPDAYPPEEQINRPKGSDAGRSDAGAGDAGASDAGNGDSGAADAGSNGDAGSALDAATDANGALDANGGSDAAADAADNDGAAADANPAATQG